MTNLTEGWVGPRPNFNNPPKKTNSLYSRKSNPDPSIISARPTSDLVNVNTSEKRCVEKVRDFLAELIFFQFRDF